MNPEGLLVLHREKQSWWRKGGWDFPQEQSLDGGNGKWGPSSSNWVRKSCLARDTFAERGGSKQTVGCVGPEP